MTIQKPKTPNQKEAAPKPSLQAPDVSAAVAKARAITAGLEYTEAHRKAQTQEQELGRKRNGSGIGPFRGDTCAVCGLPKA